MKNEKPLQRVDRLFHTVTTTDDPIIRKVNLIYFICYDSVIYLNILVYTLFKISIY